MAARVEPGAEGEHQVELVHVETEFAVDELMSSTSACMSCRCSLLSAGNLLRVARQQADVLQRARQPAAAARVVRWRSCRVGRSMLALMDTFVPVEQFDQRRELEQVGLDVRRRLAV